MHYNSLTSLTNSYGHSQEWLVLASFYLTVHAYLKNVGGDMFIGISYKLKYVITHVLCALKWHGHIFFKQLHPQNEKLRHPKNLMRVNAVCAKMNAKTKCINSFSNWCHNIIAVQIPVWTFHTILVASNLYFYNRCKSW